MRMKLWAWIVGVLVLGTGGWVAAQSVSDATTVSGQLTASEQEADEGYFALGRETMLVVKPDSTVHHWLRARAGQQVRVTIEIERGTQ